MKIKENYVFSGKGKNMRVEPVIEELPATDFLETMAGANKWHEVAQDVFIEQFLTRGKKDGNLSLVDNVEIAETLLWQGKQIVESSDQKPLGGYARIAVDFYHEYEKAVTEIGGGDVSEYAKKASRKTRKELWGF